MSKGNTSNTSCRIQQTTDLDDYDYTPQVRQTNNKRVPVALNKQGTSWNTYGNKDAQLIKVQTKSITQYDTNVFKLLQSNTFDDMSSGHEPSMILNQPRLQLSSKEKQKQKAASKKKPVNLKRSKQNNQPAMTTYNPKDKEKNKEQISLLMSAADTQQKEMEH